MSISVPAAPLTPLTDRVTDTLWFNALWFQAVWFCTVLGRDNWLPLAVALLVVHVWLVKERRNELRQLLLVGSIGIATDAALSLAGVYHFSDGVLLPFWLCCLWLAFAAALGRSLSWLRGRSLLAALAGAVAFPLNYWAGQRLGAVEFGYPLLVTLAVLALVWGAVLPLMVSLTTRLSRTQIEEAAA
ncbi:MAG: DUF2878 domain-containing protein [Pseudomonadales bacterium]|nr:DUF2878 domain-containing protein [Pseudomonadales bacterium]